jgi:hypothetical protein
VTDYVRQEFNRADDLQNDKRAGTVGFALTFLQRRLALSPEAISQSLRRRKERLESRLLELELLQRGGAIPTALVVDGPALDAEDVEDLDEAPDDEVEATEEQILDQATAARTITALKADDGILPVISTDPPYYDNVGYPDLSDFFYGWLRRSLHGIFPDLFSTLAVAKAEELVATPYRHGSRRKLRASS